MKKLLVYLWIFVCSFTTAYSQQWTALGGGAGNNIRGLYADTANHLLYAVGAFQSIGGGIADGVAVWDGENWTSLCEPSIPPDNSAIISVVIYEDELIVSGTQYQMEGEPRRILAKYDGTSWEQFGEPNRFGTLHLVDEELFFAGYFTEVGSQPIQKVARWNGNQWESFGDQSIWDNYPDVSADKIVKYKGKYIIGGNFEMNDYKEILQWDGVSWQPLLQGLLGDAAVGSMAVYKDILYVGGFFSESSGNPGNDLMAWNGEQWFDPFPNVDFFSQTWDLQVINDELYIVAPLRFPNDNSRIYGLSKFDGENLCLFGGSAPLTADTHVDARRIVGLDDKIYIACNNVFLTDTVHYIAQWNGTEMDTCLHQPVYAGITEYEDNVQSLSVYPNPNSGTFTVSWNALSSQKEHIQILNQLGQIIKTEEIYTVAGENIHDLQLPLLATGVYFIRISDADNVKMCKMIKR